MPEFNWEMKFMKKPSKPNKPRNYVVRNPLLRKGGAHVRAKSGERFANKRKTMKAAREWEGSRSGPLGQCFYINPALFV